MISDNHPDGQDDGPGPARPTWALRPLGQDDSQDDEVCIPRMMDRMMGKLHTFVFLYFGHFILVYGDCQSTRMIHPDLGQPV